jgi:DNA polymerase
MSDPLARRAAGLAEVAAETAACQRCRLYQSATKPVPGEGPPGARILFVGEAPGFQEDRQGRPFVGPAGQLLEELLAGIGLSRSDVFITNMVKHRPPGNRDPQADEIEACKPYLDRQIELVDPRVVATLGRFAMERFLPGAKISKVHGQPRRLGERVFVPILHPAAALHRGDWRPLLEADFRALRRVLDELDEAGAGPAAVDEPDAGSESGAQLSLF